MKDINDMYVAGKCAPESRILDALMEAGVRAVELYTNEKWLLDAERVISTCLKYPFRYAVHAPGEGYDPDRLAALVSGVKAEVVVFHDIYFEDEWNYIAEKLRPLGCKPCIENVLSAIDTIKFMRRFGLGRCLDIEHLILETSGIYEEPLFGLMKRSSHVHMTGYVYGGRSWHTHFHHSPEQSLYLLDMLKRAGYAGMVVSEAKESYQTVEEFKALNDFFLEWKERVNS